METTPSRRVPLARPDIGPREVELVNQVLGSGVLALGPFAEAFERAVATIASRRYGIACSSGTSGLHMGVRALGWTSGDEVITTPFSFVASINCLLYEGVVPRLVDIEEDSLGLDPAAVDALVSPTIRGILPVHVFGRPCRIVDLVATAARQGWGVLEDACEGLGSSVNGRPLGSFGDVSVFAFYPNKQVTTGEGGMVVTDTEALADVLRSLRNQGRDTDGTWLRHVRLGYNYRLDELSAALGVAQLERLAELRAARARAVAMYEGALGSFNWLRLPAGAPGEDVDWFVYVVRLEPGLDRDSIMAELASLGVPTRPYFSPLHLQPFLIERFGYQPGEFPVTERVAMSTLALPFGTRLAESEISYVATCLERAVDATVRRN